MWLHKGLKYIRPAPYKKRDQGWLEHDFQMRYTLVVLGAAALGMILTVLPIYYFLNQNYQIFVNLAYDHAPNLLIYLERERIYINTLLFGTFVGVVFFFSFLSIRLTNRIVGPLKVLRNHIKALSSGHWYQRPLQVRENDEFQDLIETYNYFYNSFQVNLKKELQLLKQLTPDPNNKDAVLAWKILIEERILQLGIDEQAVDPKPIFLNDVNPARSHGRRHVS